MPARQPIVEKGSPAQSGGSSSLLARMVSSREGFFDLGEASPMKRLPDSTGVQIQNIQYVETLNQIWPRDQVQTFNSSCLKSGEGCPLTG